MNIGIDGRVLEKKMTGIARYLINILNEIPNHDSLNRYYVFTNRPQNLIDNKYFNNVFTNYPLINSKLFTPFWLNYVIPKLIDQHKIDIFIGPNFFVPTVKVKNVKYISIIHDIIPLTHPQYFPLSYRVFIRTFLPKSIKNSDFIITNSQTSKTEIIKYFNIPEEKIEYVYNTFPNNFKPLNNIEKEKIKAELILNLPEKYFLYVGMIEVRKNIDLLINISDLIKLNKLNFKIILVGKPGFGFSRLIKEINKRKDVIIYLNHVNDSELLYLYNFAYAFIFPSFVEGFGLPPLEAMSCGLPVLASDCNALREILGEDAILHSPYDANSFLNSIMKLINDNNFYNTMKIKSIRHTNKFTKENITKKFISIIEKVYLSNINKHK
ncbi:MAG: Glycosyltransferase [Ignavibacteriae bacterium]|nr:MAG: Glycosyltransferase [Ignavibacteriota bacterium]